MALQVGEVFATMTLDTKELDTKLSQVTSQFQGLGTTLAGLGLTAAVTRPLVNAAKEIYSFGSEFEAEMSRVGAVMNLEGLGMSADEAATHMESLRDTALDLGEKTILSAMQAAEAMEALAMAGWDSSQGIETELILTMNVRELRHFFRLRCCERAQEEMQNLADTMLELCRGTAPLLFRDAGAPCVLGTCPEAHPCGSYHLNPASLKDETHSAMKEGT